MRKTLVVLVTCLALFGGSSQTSAWETAPVVCWTCMTGSAMIGPRIPFMDAVREPNWGRLHIVWSVYYDNPSGELTLELWHMRQSLSCSELIWEEPELLYTVDRPGRFQLRPAVAMSEEGCIGILHWAVGTTSPFVLQYIRPACGDEPLITEEIPNSEQNGSGRPADLIFGSDGTVHVGFNRTAPPGDHLIYAKRIAGLWTWELVWWVNNQQYPLQIVLDADGNPVMVYHHAGPIDVEKASRVFGCEGEDCWVIETVANGGDYSVGIACDNLLNECTVAYSTSEWWTDAIGELHALMPNGTWVVDSIPGGNVGRFVSIAMNGEKHPAVAYYDQTNMDLKFAPYAFVPGGSIGWFPEVVTGPELPWWRDAGRFPVITLLDGTNSEVAEIVYVQGPGAVVFSVDPEDWTNIMVAAHPSIAATSAICPPLETCQYLGDCGTTTTTPTTATSSTTSTELRPCLNCPDIVHPAEICQLINCAPDSTDPVCELCTRTNGTLDFERAGITDVELVFGFDQKGALHTLTGAPQGSFDIQATITVSADDGISMKSVE